MAETGLALVAACPTQVDGVKARELFICPTASGLLGI